MWQGKHEVLKHKWSQHAEWHPEARGAAKPAIGPCWATGVRWVSIWMRSGRGSDIWRAWYHLAWHPGHAIRHVEHEVSPRMCPEPCEATHRAPHSFDLIGWCLLYIPDDPSSFQTILHTRNSEKNVREKSRERKFEFRSFSSVFRQFLRISERSYSASFESASTEARLKWRSDQFKISSDRRLIVEFKKGFWSSIRAMGQSHNEPKTVSHSNCLLSCFYAGSRYLEVGSWQEAMSKLSNGLFS